jgi:hypothetical protein
MTEDEVILEVPSKDGLVAIRKAYISRITDASLKADGIPMTREEVLRCWKEAVEELREEKPGDRLHAYVARLDGEWEVFTMRYEAHREPRYW